jgi:cardiolipin synthase
MRAAIWRTVAVARRATGYRRREVASAAHSSPTWLARHWEKILFKLINHGGATTGNLVSLCCDGDDGMESIWRAIASARKSVWLEMYIFQADRVGRRTIEELASAAKRGCEVLVLMDALGSAGLSESALRPLRQAAPDRVHIRFFNPLRPWRWPSAMMRRDHRKIVIVDGAVGICGGLNISEDYAGTRHGNGMFHDSLVQMHGPCVRDLAAVFVSSWRMATRQRRRLPRRSQPAGATFVQVQASRGAHGRRSIQRALRLTVRNAVTHCYITTPYFIPPQRLVSAIKRAAERGVDVRILTAGVCDVPVVHLAAQHVYGSLLQHGVRIYEMYDSTLHAKTITIDGVYSTVGTFNLDTWSDKRNLEVNIAMIDPEIAREMCTNFVRDIGRACEITLHTWHKRPWWKRAIHWTAYQVLRL